MSSRAVRGGLVVVVLAALAGCGGASGEGSPQGAEGLDAGVEDVKGEDVRGEEDGGEDAGPGDAALDVPLEDVAAALDVEGEEVGEDAAVEVGEDAGEEDVAEGDAGEEDGGGDAGVPDFADEDHCGEVVGFGPVFPGVVARWGEQDAAAAWPAGGLVVVGSSTVRRWEGFAAAYTDYGPIQRGFGGAQLGEVALYAEELIVRHDPRAVLVFAGTNDVAAGVGAEVVIERFRCLRQRIGLGLGWDRPVLFVGITPTPARWEMWDVSRAVNEGVRALEAVDPALRYVDVPAAFLETGGPPAASLFVGDGLHLSPAGYALWEGVLRPAVEATVAPLPGVVVGSGVELASGTRVLLDLGPNNDGDGEDSPSPDYLGQQWNNGWSVEGDGQVLPGERLVGLRGSAGEATGIEVVVTGGFSANGWANGGLRWPEEARLGGLAVGSATGDFFYMDGEDLPGGLVFSGLDPGRRYTVRLFASRADPERRVTRYGVKGGEGEAVVLLQTSGAGAGSEGGQGNDDDVAEVRGVAPDAWGRLFIDVGVAEGRYGYLSLVELIVE